MIDDDIQERLLEVAMMTRDGKMDRDDISDVIDWCAEEIERLRAELKRWQTCEMVTESICGWDSEKTYCDVCKAVRGE